MKVREFTSPVGGKREIGIQSDIRPDFWIQFDGTPCYLPDPYIWTGSFGVRNSQGNRDATV